MYTAFSFSAHMLHVCTHTRKIHEHMNMLP